MRRQALEDELERVGPPKDPQLEQALALLADFGRFWEIEPSPAERRKLLASLFERIWEQGGAIVAVKPRAPFAQYFTAAEPQRRTTPGVVPKAGATGVKPASDTPSADRDSALSRVGAVSAACQRSQPARPPFGGQHRCC